jgi:hypothetical protein
MKTHLLTGLMTLLMLSACKENEPAPQPTLPSPTATGKNVAGCLVDGIVWRTMPFTGSAFSGSGVAILVSKRRGQDSFNVGLVLSSTYPNRIITLSGTGPAITGPFEFNSKYPAAPTPPPYPSYAIYDNPESPGAIGRFTTGPTATGKLTITHLDMTKQIIAGQFDFVAQDPLRPAESLLRRAGLMLLHLFRHTLILPHWT